MAIASTEAAISGNSLKALFNGLKLAEKPELFAETQRRYNLNYPNMGSSYPFNRYLEMVEWLRSQLFPDLDEALGYQEIGRAVTRGFFEGPAGQVLKISIRVIGPQRSVPFFFRVAGGAMPFGKFVVAETKPCFVRAILYNVPGSPEIMRGMSLESMVVANIKNPSVEYTKLNPSTPNLSPAGPNNLSSFHFPAPNLLKFSIIAYKL